MSAKTIILFGFQALFMQSALSQCTGRAAVDAPGFGPYGLIGSAITALTYDNLPGPFGCERFSGPLVNDGIAAWSGRELGCNGIYGSIIDITPTSSGGLIVTSSSPIAPTGLSVISDNAYEGILSVAGEVPFVGTSGLGGVIPTAGAGAVHHACGNGIHILASERVGIYEPAPFTSAIPPAFGTGYIPDKVREAALADYSVLCCECSY